MWLRTGCDMTFAVSIDTPFILMLRPRSGSQQWVAQESYHVEPSVPVIEHVDMYGNLCQRLVAPAGAFHIRTSADILVDDHIDVNFTAQFNEVQSLPDQVLSYLLPTRYCESDRLIDLAQNIVTGYSPGYPQVAAIVQWIQQNIRFNPDSLHYQLSAVEVCQQQEGVCRELSHLGIALCRALCIPARMVVGYLHTLQPMDFHAWFEAYVGGRWYVFDPTQAQAIGGRVTLGYGHDAADVAIFNQYGPALFPTEMSVKVERIHVE